MTVGPPAAAALKQQAAAVGATAAPLFRFGLISDVQHADKEDGFSFHGTPRFYRYALEQLDKAVDAMAAADVAFCVHLGDISECRLAASLLLLPSCCPHLLPFCSPTATALLPYVVSIAEAVRCA